MQAPIVDTLRNIRLDRKLSQENLADVIGVDAATYGRYEKGERPIKFEQVAQIAAFYKVTLDELYHYRDPEYKVEEPRQNYLKRSKVSVLVELDGLDETLDQWVKKLTAINKAL